MSSIDKSQQQRKNEKIRDKFLYLKIRLLMNIKQTAWCDSKGDYVSHLGKTLHKPELLFWLQKNKQIQIKLYDGKWLWLAIL